MRFLIAVLALLLSQPLHGGRLTAAVDLRLSCPIQGVFLDGTAVLGEAREEVIVQARPVKVPGKEGKAQQGWFSDAKITSNKRQYEANLLANGRDYAIVGYGEIVREGITSYLLSAVYQVNLATLQFKRTVVFLPERKDWSSEGVCRKL
jgi:hypothetical protein